MARFIDRDQLRLVRAWDLAWTADDKSDPDFSSASHMIETAVDGPPESGTLLNFAIKRCNLQILLVLHEHPR